MSGKGQVVEEALMKLLKELEIEAVKLPQTIASESKWRLKAYKVSWTNTRRKRREQQRSGGVEKDDEEEDEDESPVPLKRQRLERNPLLVADIYFNNVENGHTLQIFYLDGVQGKDACQQILQFIINRFNKLFE